MAKRKLRTMLVFSDSSSSEDEKIIDTKEMSRNVNQLVKNSGSTPLQNFDIYTSKIGKFTQAKRNLDKVPASDMSLDKEGENESAESEEDIYEKLTSKIANKKKPNQTKPRLKKSKPKPAIVELDEVSPSMISEDVLRNNATRHLRSSTRRSNGTCTLLAIDSEIPKRKSGGKAFSKMINALDENLKLFENIETLDESDSEDEIEEITIRIRSISNIMKFRMKLNQEFSTITKELAKELDVDESAVLIYFGSDVIHSSDTPESKKIRPSDILYCYSGSTRIEQNDSVAININEIELMVQSSLHNRKKIPFKIDKNKPLKALAEEFASQNNLCVSNISLKFDGDLVNLEESATDLDIESGDCIDIIVR